MPPRRAKLSDSQIDRLLSGDERMSAPEKAAHLEAVLSRLEEHEGARGGFAFARRWAFAGAAAAVLLVAGTLTVVRRGGQDEFFARGVADGPAFSLACPGGAGGRCVTGAKLAFRVESSGQYRYFAALAERPDGVGIWYFPSGSEGTSIPLDGLGPDRVLPEGVLLGTEHQAGSYRVRGIFSAAPMTRAQIREALQADPQAAGSAWRIVERGLEVSGR